MQEEKQLETTGRLKEIEIEVKYLEKESVRNFVRLGQLLNEARTIFNTSFAGISFDEWCRNVFGYSRTTITYFSQIANRWGNDYPKEFGSFTKLIEVIKLNDADIEDIINKEHLIAGESKKATDLTREELRQIIKEKKELQKALEQKDKDIKVLEAKTEETIQQELERRMADKQLEILQRKKEINEEVNKLNKERIALEEKAQRSLANLKRKEQELNNKENDLVNKQNKVGRSLKEIEGSIQSQTKNLEKIKEEIKKLDKEKNEKIEANKNLTDSSRRYKEIVDYLEQMDKLRIKTLEIFSDRYSNELDMPKLKENLISTMSATMDVVAEKRNKLTGVKYVEVI